MDKNKWTRHMLKVELTVLLIGMHVPQKNNVAFNQYFAVCER